MSEREPKAPLLDYITEDFSFARGHPLPLGATLQRGGINFAIFSKSAGAVTLVLFAPGQAEPMAEFPFDPRYNRTGEIWHAFVGGLNPGIEYGFRMEGDGDSWRHRSQAERVLIDPKAKGISGRPCWGQADGGYRSLVVDDNFDWEQDQPLNTPLAESVIYELHVRGFTRDRSSGDEHPGTYAGLVEKIPYLQRLGVTAVELLPVTEFDENDNPRSNPITGEPLRNFWGYHPIAFMAPKSGYAVDGSGDGAVREFKTMVKVMHRAGIEVILDVVFNHTGEGNERGPTLSFRGIDNRIYYMLDEQSGAYCNYSGCGNTVNCNHPVVRDFLLDCLRYWVTEMHVDGFRFDLASILGRGQSGEVLSNPPLLEQIAADPVLAHTKLIAEAWDAAGLYQVGSFPAWGRWAEWNGRFRDDIRTLRA